MGTIIARKRKDGTTAHLAQLLIKRLNGSNLETLPSPTLSTATSLNQRRRSDAPKHRC
jgi:hypothetical protein